MISLRAYLLFLLACGLASGTLTLVSESKKPLKLSPSVALTDQLNNPTKRDSAVQTAIHNEKPKDEPFKPMLSIPYQAQPFRSSAIQYAASETTPQVYYEKLERQGGIQYAPLARSQSVAANGGILYAPTKATSVAKETPQHSTNVYRGPLSPTYQQAGHVAAVPQYERGPSPTVSAPAAIAEQQQQHKHNAPQIFLESDAESEFMFGQVVPQHPSPQIVNRPTVHSPSRPLPSAPSAPSAPIQNIKQQQKQVQYVIAIPVEYMQQLQHHLGAISSHVPQSQPSAPTLSTTIPDSPGKIYQGIYKNLHYTSLTPTEPPVHSNPPTDYTTQYIQVPESVLQSVGAPIYGKSKYQQTYYQQQQPAAQHQRQQQQHQQENQQQLQQSTVYAYPFHQQQEQYHQPQLQPQQQQQHRLQQPQAEQQHLHQPQQQHHAQLQPHQQPQLLPQQPIVRIGVAKASTSQATAAHHLTAPSVVDATIPMPHFFHYKPIYVQQQHQQGHHQNPMSFAHYHQHHLMATPYFIRHAYMPAAAGNIYTQFDSPLRQSIAPKLSFGYPYPSLQPENADIPYLSHPGAIHYGTHLFHAPTQATPIQVLGPVATAATHQIHHQQQQQQQKQHPQQQQQQPLAQQHQQQQKQYTPAAGSHSPSSAPGAPLAKYP